MASAIPSYGPPVSRGPRADLRSNLLAGLAALVFLRVRPERWRPFASQIMALLGLDVAVSLVFSVAETGVDGVFRWDALPRALFPLGLGLLAGWLVSRRPRADMLWTTVATVILATVCWYDLLSNLLLAGRDRQWWAVGEGWDYAEHLMHAWWGLATAVAVARVAGASGAMLRVAHGAWVVAAVAAPLWWAPYTRLWVQIPEDAVQAEAPEVSREEVIYAQGRLLQSAAARLAPQRPGVEDLFFVGAAGYADEDVFLNEVSLASEMIRTRYDADGHVMLLSNNPKTVRTLPLASATSLRQTLQAVARTMDRDEDVLFLFLTTHGGEDHSLAMQFWPLQLADLRPEMLKSMLDEAGIRWRVVVVSACYAGGFIEPLRDDRTMVLAAADARNASFGCGADSDLTYFGKAFFDQALRETYSFSTAFEKARALIGERERANRFQASNPDMYVGREIALKLDRIARRMAARAGGHKGASTACARTDAHDRVACGADGTTAN